MVYVYIFVYAPLSPLECVDVELRSKEYFYQIVNYLAIWRGIYVLSRYWFCEAKLVKQFDIITKIKVFLWWVQKLYLRQVIFSIRDMLISNTLLSSLEMESSYLKGTTPLRHNLCEIWLSLVKTEQPRIMKNKRSKQELINYTKSYLTSRFALETTV